MADTTQTSGFVTLLITVLPWVTGGLAGALLTYVLKVRSERRQQKIVSINITDIDLSFSDKKTADILPIDSLKISFENQTFSYLRLYAIVMVNIGYRAVEGIKLAISFPDSTTKIKTIISSEPLSIPYTLENSINDNELIYSISRLEIKDKMNFSFLLDSQESNKIVCLPRGVDDVEFRIRSDELPEQTKEIKRSYKLVFNALLLITLLSLVISFVLGFNIDQNSQYRSTFELSLTVFKVGTGAIFGLLAGKIL